MDDILDPIREVFEGQIDFEGQKLADYVSTGMLIIVSVIALLVGFMKQDIYLSLWTGLVGTAVTMLAVVPPWPFYKQHPQPWLGSRAALLSSGITVSGQKTD